MRSVTTRRATTPELETVYEDEAMPQRPLKQPPYLTTFRVTPDGSDLPPAIPRRNPHRNTWPITVYESKPGSHVFLDRPTLVKTPWELERGKASGERSVRPSALGKEPRRTFPQLPREILHCVVDHLENVHFTELGVHASRLQKDLCSLSLTSKSWNRVAREHLYKTLLLPDEEPRKRKFGFLRHESRLRNLLRTLQTAPGLAAFVRDLRAPPELSDQLRQPGVDLDTLIDIILTCPGLERTSGLDLSKRQVPAKYYHALATRSHLKEHEWPLSQVLDCGATLARSEIIECHAHWRQLHTLALDCDGGLDKGFGQGAVAAVLHRLPALKNLVLRGFTGDDFHNGTLLTLPALHSLTLERMSGVTDEGLQQLCHTHLTWTLGSLSLLDLPNVGRLRTIQKVLAHFSELEAFTLRRSHDGLGLPPGIDSAKAVSMPMLTSSSLSSLHWCLPSHTDSTVPNDILLASIDAGGFPRLRNLCT
ncbi:hypothetical protein MBLNU230_g3407t1 [Neophaeotheca triangularis]